VSERWNGLQWDGRPGHYEVYYLTFTDPVSRIGFWIRYTMLAPFGGDATCALWFLAMDPANPAANVARKQTLPATQLLSRSEPFRLEIGSAWLNDEGAAGAIDQDGGTRCEWELDWTPRLPAYGHVHPLLRATLAKTILFLPHPDIEISGTIGIGERRISLSRARGGQAHLWGSKHAQKWAWAHCNDFVDVAGDRRADTFVDGVSVFVHRFGRTLGPNTPVVARVGGRDLLSTRPLAVARNPSSFDLDSWRFEARTPRRKLVGTVAARQEDLIGVTYQDPDGEAAYCYNTEVAGMRIEVHERPLGGRWRKVDELHCDGRAHFEYAQREPVSGAALLIA
jgi:hypothetical protein